MIKKFDTPEKLKMSLRLLEQTVLEELKSAGLILDINTKLILNISRVEFAFEPNDIFASRVQIYKHGMTAIDLSLFLPSDGSFSVEKDRDSHARIFQIKTASTILENWDEVNRILKEAMQARMDLNSMINEENKRL